MTLNGHVRTMERVVLMLAVAVLFGWQGALGLALYWTTKEQSGRDPGNTVYI